jgi:hypothetical protein
VGRSAASASGHARCAPRSRSLDTPAPDIEQRIADRPSDRRLLTCRAAAFLRLRARLAEPPVLKLSAMISSATIAGWLTVRNGRSAPYGSATAIQSDSSGRPSGGLATADPGFDPHLAPIRGRLDTGWGWHRLVSFPGIRCDEGHGACLTRPAQIEFSNAPMPKQEWLGSRR